LVQFLRNEIDNWWWNRVTCVIILLENIDVIVIQSSRMVVGWQCCCRIFIWNTLPDSIHSSDTFNSIQWHRLVQHSSKSNTVTNYSQNELTLQAPSCHLATTVFCPINLHWCLDYLHLRHFDWFDCFPTDRFCIKSGSKCKLQHLRSTYVTNGWRFISVFTYLLRSVRVAGRRNSWRRQLPCWRRWSRRHEPRMNDSRRRRLSRPPTSWQLCRLKMANSRCDC